MARALTVSIPGDPTSGGQNDADQDAESTTETADQPAESAALAPDVAAIVQAEVARALAAQNARAAAAVNAVVELPTQDEGRAQLLDEFAAFPNKPSASVLTKDGWLAIDNPQYSRQRDQDGFSKA
jgi:hypothetical protein